MLQAIRTRAGGIVVKTLFGLLILSFGFWGLYTRSSYFQDRSPETEIATVGDETIRAQDLQQALEPALERLRQQLGGAIDRDQVKQLGVLDTLLNGLIDRALLDQEGRRLGLVVSDDVIRDAIAGNPAFRGPDGRFDRGLFQQLLAMNRLGEDQFVARMKSEVPRTDILHAVTAGALPPREMVNALYRYRNETRTADIVALPLAAAPAIPAPSDDELNKYYEAHQDQFRAPEYRGFTMVGLDAGEMAAGIQIPEDKLKSEYEQRKEDFAVPEQRQVEQVIAPSEDKANAVEEAVTGGKDLKDAAQSVLGRDPVDLGLLKRADLPEELAGTAFDLQQGQVSEPIKTAFGWNILRVVKTVPSTTQSFDQAKAELAAQMAREEAAGRLDKIANQADDALAGGGSLADVAAKFGLKTTAVEGVDVGGRGPDGKPVALPVAGADVLKTVFQTEQGDTSRIIDTQDGAIYAVHVDKIVAPRVKPLAEVKDAVAAAWEQERKREAVLKEAKDLAAAAGPDKPLKALAAERKLTVTTPPPLSRRPRPDAGAPPALVARLFAAKPGEVVTAEDGGGAYVAQLQEVKDPGAPSDAAATELSEQLAGKTRLDLATEFTAALRNRFPIKIDRDALDRTF